MSVNSSVVYKSACVRACVCVCVTEMGREGVECVSEAVEPNVGHV